MKGGFMDIKVDSRIKRSELHAKFGGRTQGKISPSKSAPYVMIFADAADETKGIVCGLGDDGALHIAGEGLSGDQKLKSGNHSILNHASEARSLHIFFRVDADVFRYVGEFEVDVDSPFYRVDAPDTKDEAVVRDSYVFRLLPKGTIGQISRSRLVQTASQAIARDVFRPIMPIGGRQPYSVETAAQDLLSSYASYLLAEGVNVRSFDHVPDGEYQSVVVPLFDEDSDTLIVSSGTTSRAAIRNVVGEITDLQRMGYGSRAIVVLPDAPRADLLGLLDYAGINITWPVGSAWHDAYTTARDIADRSAADI
jgi:hypothetical protein